MRRKFARLIALPFVACVSIGAGCGGTSADSTAEEATVKGRVTIRGKPATRGLVTFDPTNINRPNSPIRSVEIRQDGTYQATTLVGSNSVSVSASIGSRPMPGMSADLGLVVRRGENTLDIPLPPTGD